MRDGRNLSPQALIEGRRAQLVRSPTARTVDVVTLDRNGRVVERLQVKDLTSDRGVRDLAERVREGRYRSAKLVGTDETAFAWGRRGSPKAMERSGISSDATTRAADNAGSRVRSKDLLASNARDVARCAAGAAALGAVAGGVGEAVGAYGALRDGEIDGVEYAKRVAVGTASGAVGAGGRTAAALALKEGAKQATARGGAEALRRAAGSNAGTAVAFAAVEQAIDTVRLVRGDIDGGEYGARTCGTVGTAGGAYAGAMAGAAVGSAVPVVGTAIGAAIGGLIGALGGGALGRGVGRGIFE